MSPHTLEEWNRQVGEAFRRGEKSIFRSSFELSEDVVNRVLASQDELPYLRIACWMQHFFQQGNGINFFQCWNDQQAAFILERIWGTVYGEQEELTRYTVKSRVWTIAGEEHGYASDIWKTIRLCTHKTEAQDGDIFQPETYRNDNPPQQLVLLLQAYQAGKINGQEFADVIMAVRRREPVENGSWYAPLLKAIQRQLQGNTNTASCNFFIRWGGADNLTADYIVGFERNSSKEIRIEIDNDRKSMLSAFGSFALPIGQEHTVSTGQGRRKEELVTDGNPCGIYQAYKASARDFRKNWWQPIPAKNGAVPYRTHQVLIVRQEDVEIAPVLAAAGFSGVTVRKTAVCFGLDRKPEYQFYLIDFVQRPFREVSIEIGGTHYIFAGARPILTVEGGLAEKVTAEDALLVFGKATIHVENMENLESCSWEINGQRQESSSIESIEIHAEKDHILDCWIKCIPFAGGRRRPALHLHAIVVPAELLGPLTLGGLLPDNWHTDHCPPSRRAIDFRVQNFEEIRLCSPSGEELSILRQTNSPFWWFDSSVRQVEPCPTECQNFERLEDIDSIHLFIPGNAQPLDLTLQGQAIDVHPLTNQDGIVEIVLTELFAEQTNFSYGENLPRQTLFLNRQPVCSVCLAPRSPIIIQNEEGAWGVFLPIKKAQRAHNYRVLVFSDHLGMTDLGKPPECLKCIEWKASEQASFISLQEEMGRYLASHKGEVFAVLVPEPAAQKIPLPLVWPFFNNSSVRAIRTCEYDYMSEEARKAATILRTAWKDAISPLDETHVLKQSRLWKNSHTRLQYGECESYWASVKGYPEMWPEALRTLLFSGYNFILEPEWVNQSKEELYDTVRKHRGNQRISNPIRQAVNEALMDLGGAGLWNPLWELSTPTNLQAEFPGYHSEAFRIQVTPKNPNEEVSDMTSLPHRTQYKRIKITICKDFLDYLLPGYSLEDDELIQTLQEQLSDDVWETLVKYAKSLASEDIFRSSQHLWVREQMQHFQRRLDQDQSNGRKVYLALRNDWRTVFLLRIVANIVEAGACDKALIAIVAMIAAMSTCAKRVLNRNLPLEVDGAGYRAALECVKLMFQRRFSPNLNNPSRNHEEPWKRLGQAVVRLYAMVQYLFAN